MAKRFSLLFGYFPVSISYYNNSLDIIGQLLLEGEDERNLDYILEWKIA